MTGDEDPCTMIPTEPQRGPVLMALLGASKKGGFVSQYLLIESRDPFDSPDTGFVHDLSRKLVEGGHQVTVFLVQNGVLPARPCIHSAALTSLAQAGVTILADDFSLRERGIAASSLIQGVRAAALDVVIDGMAGGAKLIWH
jgi:hypothetical protein